MLTDAIDDIILGRNVKRGNHRLIWNEKRVSEDFTERLKHHGFVLNSVKETNVQPGQRVPGFRIKDEFAIFGYVFWEIFNDRKKRKLWGSVEKNNLGDWKYILTEFKEDKVWVQLQWIEEINLPEYKRYG